MEGLEIEMPALLSILDGRLRSFGMAELFL